MTSFERCCTEELLSTRLLADRPPLILDLLLDFHPEPAKLWTEARSFCADVESGCQHAEVYFSGVHVSRVTGHLQPRDTDLAGVTRAFLDVGAHVQSRFLERLDNESDMLLIAFEPDRASAKYQLDYAKNTLSPAAQKRFWLLPTAVGPTMGLSVLHRANNYFDGQCSSLLEFRADAVAWEGCTLQTGKDIVSMMPLVEVLFLNFVGFLYH